MNNRYLFIFEDGSLTVGKEIPEEVRDAFENGLYDVVDMETRTQLGRLGDTQVHDVWVPMLDY